MDTKIIEAVDRIATNAHVGQVRKNSGIPYIS